MRTSQLVFACHSKACAPPPAGTGGSSPSGGVGGAAKSAHAATKQRLAVEQLKSGSNRAEYQDRDGNTVVAKIIPSPSKQRWAVGVVVKKPKNDSLMLDASYMKRNDAIDSIERTLGQL